MDKPLRQRRSQNYPVVDPSNSFIPFRQEEAEQSISDRFEQQVRMYPDRLAVKTKNYQFTYEALNQAANRVAWAILAQRQKGDEPILLLLESGAASLIAILGVLKARKFYVPLEPLHPPTRLMAVLEDSQAGLILTNKQNLHLASKLAQQGCQVMNIDDLGPNLSPEDPHLSIPPESLACIVYTSGSTGRPKGVIHNHRNVLYVIKNYTNALHVCAMDRLSHLYSSSVVGGLRTIFLCLLNGATLLPFDIEEEGLAHLAPWLMQEEITFYCSIPTVFRHFIRTLNGEEAFPKLRLIRLGGEPIYRSDVDLYKTYFSQQSILVCALGSTETFTYRWNFINKTTQFTTNTVPAGYAFGDTEVLVVDEHGHEVGVDRIGEIVVKRRDLALGYWGQPHRTREVFRPDPTGGDIRLYYTGDMGRIAPDGCLEHLGRKDFQVKIRGHRIEITETEIVLRDHPAIAEAVVVARTHRSGEQHLVAYLVPSQQPVPTVGALRHFVQERLPEFMVPSAFVVLDALPLTPNGKVDRRALPESDQVRPELEETYVAPRTPVEEVLAGFWAQVLNVEHVGIHDDFFQLGGDSLLAMQLLIRVREVMHVEVPFRSFFDMPTAAEMAKRIETASRTAPAVHGPPLRPLLRNGPLALSFAQQRLWFIEQLELSHCAYNLLRALRLDGPLHVPALAQALQEIIRRHEVLRTTFTNIDGQPLQVISPTANLSLSVVDLQELPEREREARVRMLVCEEAQQPFDLAQGPLVRTVLLRLAAEEHVLLLTMHHIASDGWSQAIFWQELQALYQAFSAGNPSPLAELPIQYADFAVWQRQWLQGEVLEAQLAYWKQQLAGIPTLQLPTDHPRPAVQSFRGARQPVVFSSTLTQELKVLSRRQGVTLFMTLLAAFQTLLHRYTAQDDIAIGSPTAGRTRTEVEGVIGFFVNTLVLRTDLSGDPSFLQLLERVREVTLGAFSHQDLPFEKLVEELQPERDLSHNPLFQVQFVLQNTPRQAPELAGLTLTLIEVDSGTAKFDLTLELTEASEGLRGWFEYSTDLFDATTIGRMAGHLQTLLEGIVADPEQRLSALRLLTADERRQLLAEWNNPAMVYSQDDCVHEVFEAQVERTPDAIAVLCEDASLTYRELNRRANQLAHYLRNRGVGPEVLVGLCIERSPEMVVGLLGILKAGGAYVPLDPADPQERLAFMLENAQASVLLTVQRLVERLPRQGPHIICVDAAWETIGRASRGNPIGGAAADNLAYVIYTSGSTGKPKGTMISHQGLSNYLHWCTHAYPIKEGRGVPIHSSLTFDLTVTSVFAPLMVGQMIVLVPNDAGVEGLAAILQANKNFSLVKVTPAHLRLLSPQLSGENGSEKIRSLVIGGEALSAEDIALWRGFGRDTLLFNEYGPTETVVGCCMYQVPSDFEISGSIPIGRPIANTQLYVLDPHLQPVPVGIPGELYIGGVGLARGYLRRPEPTAEMFIPHSFSNVLGARLYKTGDRVRYLPDGNIEFLGRLDHQVKMRGFRIELGEIETVLGQHPAVRQAVVLAREDVPGDRRLVAYIIPSQKQAPAMSELRSFLQEKLPEYMVPSAFVLLEALPLTPNGKLDRRVLPAPEGLRPELQALYVVPRTEIERMIATVWQEVLRIERVGLYDNFFDLGGHSLLLVQVHSKLREVFGEDLSIIDMFKYPSINALTKHLSEKKTERVPSWQRDDAIEQLNAGMNRLKQLHQRKQRTRGNG
jgi:amino acid adenylation domain-containing protein